MAMHNTCDTWKQILSRLFTIKRLHCRRGVHIVYEVATNMMTDALKDSSIGITVERARDWTTVALDFMLRDKEVYSHLAEMLTYDGNVLKHSVNTAILGLLFGYYLEMPVNDLLTLGTGLLLHDIGKAKIDLYIIKKRIWKS